METDMRAGYMKIGSLWKPVKYTVVDGRAIVEGCIILGTVQEVEQIALSIRNNPALFSGAAQLAPVQLGAAQPFAAATKGFEKRWPGKRIPYVINDLLPEPMRVLNAISNWEAHTELRFSKRGSTDRDYVEFIPAAGCGSSSIGFAGNRQYVEVGPECKEGNIMHEIGHIVGLFHETSRSDRDDFVEIFWDLIDPLKRDQFCKVNTVHDNVDLGPYDYGSIMHYGPTDFAIDQKSTTIKAKQQLPAGVEMGQRNALSPGDIQAISKLYGP